jgi:YD repeat-containing protein
VGRHWRFCLLESAAIRESETRLTVTLPFGPRVYFVRSNTDPTQYFSADREWLGRLKGDAFQAVCARWEMTFWRGRLQTLVEKEKKRALTVLYNGTTPLGLRDDYLHQLVVQVVQEPGQPFPSALVAQRQAYGLEFAGQELQRITYPQQTGIATQPGNQDRLSWGAAAAGQPQLRITLREGGELLRVWKAKTRWIVTDGEWNYGFTSTGKKGAWPAASRTNRQGRVEAYAFDNLRGVSTYRALDGTVTKKHYFMTKGPLWMKFRRQETLTNGQMVVTRRMDYDTAGRKLREEGAQGLTEYTYDAAGRLTLETCNGRMVWRKTYDAKGRLTREEHADGRLATYIYQSDAVFTRQVREASGICFTERMELGEVRQWTGPQGQTYRYTYYPGRHAIKDVTYADGSVQSLRWDWTTGQVRAEYWNGRLRTRYVAHPKTGERVRLEYAEGGQLKTAVFDADHSKRVGLEELSSMLKIVEDQKT